MVKKTDIEQLSNWAIKRTITLGYDAKLHGDFDVKMNYNSSDRYSHKPERVGKKYQWIALHELLARVSDKFPLKDIWADTDGKYEWPSQVVAIRDIDPSCDIQPNVSMQNENMPNFNNYNNKIKYSCLDKKMQPFLWLKNVNDLPVVQKFIELSDDLGNMWIALENDIDWQESAAIPNSSDNISYPPTKKLYYMLKSYLVKNTDKKEIFRWAKQQDFYGRWMPESVEFYNEYLGEYPWCSEFSSNYYGWVSKQDMPGEVLCTCNQYIKERGLLDCSADDGLRIKLPAKLIIEEMVLTHKYMDGRFYDRQGDLVAYDPSLFGCLELQAVIIRKDKLCSFLDKNGYSIIWTLLGEKYIGGVYSASNVNKQIINGVYTLNKQQKLIGTKNSKFQ